MTSFHEPNGTLGSLEKTMLAPKIPDFVKAMVISI